MKKHEMRFPDSNAQREWSRFHFGGLPSKEHELAFERFASAMSDAVDAFGATGQSVVFSFRQSLRCAAFHITTSIHEPWVRNVSGPIEVGRLRTNRKQVWRTAKLGAWATSRAARAGDAYQLTRRAMLALGPVLSLTVDMLMRCRSDDRTIRSILRFVVQKIIKAAKGEIVSSFGILRGIVRLRNAGGIYPSALPTAI